MYIDLSGEWSISLEADEGKQSGVIMLPGILQGSGYGNPITRQTPWVSSLHDSLWYEQEEYKFAQEEGVNVPFLSQPPRHFLGQAVYERKFTVPQGNAMEESMGEWHFHVEAARWRSQVWLDGELVGEDCSLCTPHDIRVGKLAPGEHDLRVVMDNSMIYPYRPDAHGVSDALGATWNGMVGEISLFTEDVARERESIRREYARQHPKSVKVEDGRFLIDGEPFYFRATHFGGEYPLTGYPATDKAWWLKMMRVIKEWGLNGIRFHSYCPPDAAFRAADEEGVYLLVECGMWNQFGDDPEGKEMNEVLKKETRRILEYFGHHPSFAFFSPSNEPSGPWVLPLKRWVEETREYDGELGYEGRRIYTAQSGWPYEVPPSEIRGTDFIYFHRSGNGYRKGGTIRGHVGWKGGVYSSVLEGVRQPVVCHELGQICAYPNYAVIDKYTGYLQPGNYKVFRENARANGVLTYGDVFVKGSGENQIRLYKEELEANFRTPELQGFELLDLHDYLGQGTALVGILDAFWENKGYGDPEEFKNFCGDTVLLARCGKYVWKNTDTAEVPVEICHYGKQDICNGVIQWNVCLGNQTLQRGELKVERITRGGNTKAGTVALGFEEIMERARECLAIYDGRQFAKDEKALWEGQMVRAAVEAGNVELIFSLELPFVDEAGRERIVRNHWNLYVFTKPLEEASEKTDTLLYTRDWTEAKMALEAGMGVVYSPYLSDLNYECPPLSGESVGWNAQMGPTWCRTMGIVAAQSHPIFRMFPTGRWGGWQWENILKRARGFHMEGLEQVEPIVQPIDDWNRNLLQSLIFEVKVSKGRLLVVSAGLEGSFEERPEAFSLKQAILKYAASEAFVPSGTLEPEQIENKLFPILRMRDMTKEIRYQVQGADMDENQVKVQYGEAVIEADANTFAKIMAPRFPVEITVLLQRDVSLKGILYVPQQRDKDHEGMIKEYRIQVIQDGSDHWETVAEGTLLNTCRSQRILFEEEVSACAFRMVVLSAYGCEDKFVWDPGREGWFRRLRPGRALVQIAGLHAICDLESSHDDVYTIRKNQKSLTREIEL